MLCALPIEPQPLSPKLKQYFLNTFVSKPCYKTYLFVLESVLDSWHLLIKYKKQLLG